MRYHLLAIVVMMFLTSCRQEDRNLMRIAGNAQGTTYHISWMSNDNINHRPAIDSILKVLDSSLSTYLPVSIISRINKNDSSVIVDDHFAAVFKKAAAVSEKTGGAFDITVGPLINAWGFGFTKKASVDSAMIDSLLLFTGYKMVELQGNKLTKAHPEIMLDFNAIAQGYSVDVLAAYLEEKGIQNYLVELGGELKTKGTKEGNIYWTAGIDQPNETETDERPLQAIVKMKDKALATSGNYRKYYVEDGRKHAHIIDPHTGYPAKHNLLSASVFATDCMTADAYATAFMVMGIERSKQFLAEHPELSLEVLFIYEENGVWKTYSSATIQPSIEEVN